MRREIYGGRLLPCSAEGRGGRREEERPKHSLSPSSTSATQKSGGGGHGRLLMSILKLIM